MNTGLCKWIVSGWLTVATLAVLAGGSARSVDAYVLPPEQIVRFMTANFSTIRSLEITQTVLVRRPSSERSEQMIEERIWLKAPASYGAELVGVRNPAVLGGQESPANGNEESPSSPAPPLTMERENVHAVFRRFLMANGVESILDLLGRLGIPTESVGWERMDGRVAYRIGTMNPGGPRFLVEKDRFLPLLLRYAIPDEGEPAMLTVRFEAYEKHGDGWYPHEIIFSSSTGTMEIYRITQIQVNVPIQAPLVEITTAPLPASTWFRR